VIVNDKLAKSANVFFRSIYFFPSLISLTFVAVIWRIFFQTDSGVINFYLNFVGVHSVPWLSNEYLSKVSVLIIDIWKNCGMSMLLILSGLQTIDKSLMEAAGIDGATELKKFVKITFPLLTPTIFFVLIMHMTGSLRIFESAFVLTNGGPGDSSRSLVMLITEKAFTSFNYGQANALSMLLMLLIAVITALQFMASKRWVNYDQ
jgi:multiple sugar transport system permease protein